MRTEGVARFVRLSAALLFCGAGSVGAFGAPAGSNYDGTLDPTLQPTPFAPPFYGIAGLLEFAIDAGGDAPYRDDDSTTSILVQPDGKIVVAGFAWTDSAGVSKNIGYLQRFTVEGSLDPTFGNNGRVTSEWFGGAGEIVDAYLQTIALQGDGRIVVGGSLHWRNANLDSGIVMRFNADGSFDNTFGNGSLPQSGSSVTRVMIGGDDSIYAIGFLNSTASQFSASFIDAFGVYQYGIAESIGAGSGEGDRAYDAVLEFVPSQSCGDSCVIPAHEELYLVGTAFQGTYPSGLPNHDCAVLALRRNLTSTQFSVDTLFNAGGKLTVDFPMAPANEGDNLCRKALPRPDGGVVVAGENFFISTLGGGNPGLASNYALAEIDRDANVTRQDAFAFFQELPTPGIFNGIFGMDREANGKIVIGGYASTSDISRAPSDVGVIRFNADFTRDATFGNDGLGLATLTLDGQSGLHSAQREWASALAYDNRGRIVIAGERSYDIGGLNPNDYDWLIARLNTSDIIFRDSVDGVVPPG